MHNPLQSPRYLTALAYAEQGIPVFPCVVGGKFPATQHSFKDRTTDRASIDRWWLNNDYNVAVVPDDMGCFVIDLDPKNNGLETWHRLICDKIEPTTRTVITPSGGLHLYFLTDIARRPCAGKLGDGIDIRGADSYVLIPPSIVNGREYRVQ